MRTAMATAPRMRVTVYGDIGHQVVDPRRGRGMGVGGKFPQLDTRVQVGPTGTKLLPLTVNAGQAPTSMVTRTEMGEALDRVVEALAGASEEEVAAALTAADTSGRRRSAPKRSLRTPLREPAGSSNVCSEVE
jgi:hypothetical protein